MSASDKTPTDEQALRRHLDTLDRMRLVDLVARLARERPELTEWLMAATAPPSATQTVRRRIAEQQTLAREARRRRFLLEDVKLLLGRRERVLAEDLAIARSTEFQDVERDQLDQLCEVAETAGAWLVAVIVRRSMLEGVLNGARTADYPVAARHLMALRQLDRSIEDYRGAPTHLQYEARLHFTHDQKRNFWERVETLSLDLYGPQATQPV